MKYSLILLDLIYDLILIRTEKIIFVERFNLEQQRNMVDAHYLFSPQAHD